MDFKLSEMQQDIAKLAKDFAEKNWHRLSKNVTKKKSLTALFSTKWAPSAFSASPGKKKTAA